jgi:hypothetical protein
MIRVGRSEAEIYLGISLAASQSRVIPVNESNKTAIPTEKGFSKHDAKQIGRNIQHRNARISYQLYSQSLWRS